MDTVIWLASSMNTDENENICDALSSTKYWFSKMSLKISRSFVWFNEPSVLFPTERPNESLCYSDITLFVIVISPCLLLWYHPVKPTGTQAAVTCSKLTIKTVEPGVKYVLQS